MVEVQFAKTQTIQQLGSQLRVDSIRATTQAGSGHPTSSMSAADLMAVLMVKYLKYDFDKPENPNNDRLIFSKGHAAPLLYAMYKAAGAVSDEELMTLRKFGSRLEGHPVPKIIPWVDVATGSLGQGLAMGVGMSLNGKYLDKLDYRVWVLLGDSEMAEGSVWEAMMSASYYKLDNITAILDMNRLGQRGETELGWDSRTYAERARAFGWNVIEINGHDYDQIDQALGQSVTCKGQPTFIVAKTEKGHGFPEIANKDGWHGKPLSAEQAVQAIEGLGGIQNSVIKVQKPEEVKTKLPATTRSGEYLPPKYDKPIATREAYGDALKALGGCQENVVALDAEVGNSTYSEKFGKAYMDRFFEMFIAEQLMVGAAIGLSTRAKIPFASTFAAFLSRAYDFIRMAAISRARICLAGSHAGVSIGQDGPSQMALEDLSMMRSIFDSIVLYPSDGTSTAALIEHMADYNGISYMRTTREKTPILYKSDEKFEIGGSKVLKSSKDDKATLIGAGITLHECLKAYETLQKEGINVRVIDLYSVKPVDAKTIKAAAKETGTLVVVEDHWPEGGLGDAVLDVFAGKGTWTNDGSANGGSGAPRVIKVAVKALPGSGTPEELMDAAGISAKHIVEAVKSVK
ncbi:MAG: transketolase [Cyanobacteria bacterium SZAS LIN-5]|nr:transketolase [Cyanobacteria bacterium SZAS LIN-5]RTL37678.1 MAG: transketolase [Candidatus Melainabacteria bacterium]